MGGNFQFIREHNEELYLLWAGVEAKIKTDPRLSVERFCEAFPSFVAFMCADNDIAFDRYKSSTLLNMVFGLLEAGIISPEDKAIIDELRMFVNAVEQGTLEEPVTIDFAAAKAEALFEVMKRYYDREELTFDRDRIPFDDIVPDQVWKRGGPEDTFDAIYFCYEQENGKALPCMVTQYGHERQDALPFFAQWDVNKLLGGLAKAEHVVAYSRLDTAGEEAVFLYCPLQPAFERLTEDALLQMDTKTRISLVEGVALALSELHKAKPAVSLNGKLMGNIHIKKAKKGKLEVMLSGVDELLGKAPYTRERDKAGMLEARGEDLFSFGRLVKKVLPEYRRLCGSLADWVDALSAGDLPTQKPKADKVYKTVHKSCRKWKSDGSRLCDILAISGPEKEEPPAILEETESVEVETGACPEPEWTGAQGKADAE